VQFKAFKIRSEYVVAIAHEEIIKQADERIDEMPSAVSAAEKRIIERRDKAIATISCYAALVHKQ
jgi:hypothetical protein